MTHSHFLFFNDTATTEIYTLSLHDALPISVRAVRCVERRVRRRAHARGAPARARATDSIASTTAWGRCSGSGGRAGGANRDRKSTRLNSSHANISYAVFCLKKKKHKLPYNI